MHYLALPIPDKSHRNAYIEWDKAPGKLVITSLHIPDKKFNNVLSAGIKTLQKMRSHIEFSPTATKQLADLGMDVEKLGLITVNDTLVWQESEALVIQPSPSKWARVETAFYRNVTVTREGTILNLRTGLLAAFRAMFH